MRMTIALAAALVAAAPAAAQTTAAQPSAGGRAAAADVDAFARGAAENSLAEVLMSTIALQKTNDKRVQDYAWTMLDHHSRAMGDLAEALSDGAGALPRQPGREQRAELDRLDRLEGAAFDQAFFQHQLQAHSRAIALFEAGGRLADRDVAHYARVTLPVLRAHREIAQIRQVAPPEPLRQP